MVSDGDEDMESFIRGSKSNNDGSKDDFADNSFSSSPPSMKPMYAMAQWRYPRTRDGRLAVFIVLPTGTIDRDDGIKLELATSNNLQLSFSWPPALLDAYSIMRAILSFTEELRDGQGPLMAQGMCDYTEPCILRQVKKWYLLA